MFCCVCGEDLGDVHKNLRYCPKHRKGKYTPQGTTFKRILRPEKSAKNTFSTYVTKYSKKEYTAEEIAETERRAERDESMLDMYKSGETLQEIGTKFNITRERVRQILAACDLTGLDGGIHVKAAAAREKREARKALKREMSTVPYMHCRRSEIEALIGKIRTLRGKGTITAAYDNQCRSAANRGIPWDFTFPIWYRMWEESGFLPQRGIGIGKYCMARKNDSGRYSPDNVYFTTCDDNVRDYQASLKTIGIDCKDGYKRLPDNPRVKEMGIQP